MKTILVAEDNDSNYILMTYILKRSYQFLRAKNGQEAVDMVENGGIDLVLMDIKMPVMDGLELTQQLKNDPNYQHLPIILLTAKTQEENRAEALQLGADSYVTKPFKMSDLELRINNIVENRKRIKEEFIHQGAIFQTTIDSETYLVVYF